MCNLFDARVAKLYLVRWAASLALRGEEDGDEIDSYVLFFHVSAILSYCASNSSWSLLVHLFSVPLSSLTRWELVRKGEKQTDSPMASKKELFYVL